MKILVYPRENNNPYQALLYSEMARQGVQSSYLGRVTPSHTINQLLLPLELVVRRAAGAQLVHIHWTYGFRLRGSSRFPLMRRAAQAWFMVWLWTLRSLGFRLVWTAHNVLPVYPVFADDLQVRRRLVAECDLVICHSQSTLAQLLDRGIVPRGSTIIPHGPYTPILRCDSLRPPGAGTGPRRLLFLGRVEPYKGVEDLLIAVAALDSDLDVRVTIAGECNFPALKEALIELARRSPECVELRLERIPDEEVSQLLEGADVVVLPYRQITTSGSAMLALSHGRPLIVPNLAGLADLPDDAVLRYDGTVQELTTALTNVVMADASVLAKMSSTAYNYCSEISWIEIARATIDTMMQVLDN
jgi:glycosyltransferase involved in cell wall biosynthesis